MLHAPELQTKQPAAILTAARDPSLPCPASCANDTPMDQPPTLSLPAVPALVALYHRALILTEDGEWRDLAGLALDDYLHRAPPPLLVHRPASFRQLGLSPMPAFDLLELFAFVRPARQVPPTVRGLALALDLPAPLTHDDELSLLPRIAENLLAEMARGRALPINREAAVLCARLDRAGWVWAPFLRRALGEAAESKDEPLKIWRHLPEWEETAPAPAEASFAVSESDARARLAVILGSGAEQRPGQADYAGAASLCFTPRERQGAPNFLLAEAGTGTGKTLGYIAPASLWAERNGAPVWVSTYTRHLQRQIESEMARLHPDPALRRQKVVVRKGRENYLCLLNYEDAYHVAASGAAPMLPLGLLARWALRTEDGDLSGGDLPGWFVEIFGAANTLGLADRRGECIHGACPHYKICFVEHTIRRAKSADLVVANHALVMAQAAWGGADDATVPTRYVFDEGHHLFDAADNAFAVELSGQEAGELRRWILGAEGGRSRARGLRWRLQDLVAAQEQISAPLEAVCQAAHALPGAGFASRLDQDDQADMLNQNPSEAFLAQLRKQILARQAGPASDHLDQECDLYPVSPGVAEAASLLLRALERLGNPLTTLIERLRARLEDEAEELDPSSRSRIEAAANGLERRALARVLAWIAMLRAIEAPTPEPGVRPDYVMFLHLARTRGQDQDVGLHRHWLDPTIPFSSSLILPAHGVLVTSATLRDGGEWDTEAAWEQAEAYAGAAHLSTPAIRAQVNSPFDYRTQTRAFVISDVALEAGPVAAAYRDLFRASGGGALGLFTAISRLKAVHQRIAPELEKDGFRLLAQHVDAMDNATLVDVFRTEPDSCLLGTDAMRDGVDVPGRALRLVVFDRVPWPRPDILHRERRIHLSQGNPGQYDDRIVRMRLRQAFGRLIRSATDHGVFVLLDRRTPSRVLSAFPPGVNVERVGIAEAVAKTREFLAQIPPPGIG